MKYIFHALFIAIFFGSFDVEAFHWKRCMRSEPLDSSVGSWSTVVVFGLINASISTGQFSTSTGDCAAIGMTSEERAQSFYAFNSDKVLEDLAKGKGEYLSSIEHLWGCSTDVKKVRSQYRDILLLDTEKQYQAIRESCQR